MVTWAFCSERKGVNSAARGKRMLCSVVVFEQVFILCCVAVEVVGPEAFVGVGGCAF